MKKVVQKIFTYVLLLFITLSSVGISFYLHHCGCRETTFFSLKAGYSEADAFCCCSMEPQSPEINSCSNELTQEKCCKEQYYFILLPFGPEKVTSDVKPLFGKTLNLLNTAMILKSDRANTLEPELKSSPPPLLLSGKLLVYFTHQIKIPFPIS